MVSRTCQRWKLCKYNGIYLTCSCGALCVGHSQDNLAKLNGTLAATLNLVANLEAEMLRREEENIRREAIKIPPLSPSAGSCISIMLSGMGISPLQHRQIFSLLADFLTPGDVEEIHNPVPRKSSAYTSRVVGCGEVANILAGCHFFQADRIYTTSDDASKRKQKIGGMVTVSVCPDGSACR